MYSERESEKHGTVARFQITKFQYLLFAIATVSILALGFFSITQSNETVKEATVLSDVESPAASIIFTQRETLVYATRLAQWSNGGTTRRTVQIARNILAQRLAVIDTSGRSMGSRARASYWDALEGSDAIVAESPSGVLPEGLHFEVNQKISPIIDSILTQSRELAVAYQRSVDKELTENARREAERDRLSLLFFYIFILSGSLFLFLNFLGNFKNYRLARVSLKKEQDRLNQTLDDLHRAEDTVVELQNLNDAKNAFISTVNHELRTPLTSIIGYIELLHEESKVPNADLTKYLDVLDRNAQILLHVVESILLMSKIDANEGVRSNEKVSINQVIDDSLVVMKPAIEAAGQSISVTSEEELFVEGDEGQLCQVLINLIGNAHKFSPKDSLIEISLDSAVLHYGAEYARITVKDHGIGIPQDDIENLAIRFFRAKNTDSGQFPGTGLGLAIVQQILKLHDGTLSISSKLGEGTTITVLIPLFLTEENRLIRDRAGDVLKRAIESLEESTPQTIEAVTHSIGGVIGFYGFEKIGEEILMYSRSVSDAPPSDESFLSNKNRLLSRLIEAQTEIGGKADE